MISLLIPRPLTAESFIQDVDYQDEDIIAEDNSTDRTRVVVFDYQRKYPGIIKVVNSDKNVGAF